MGAGHPLNIMVIGPHVQRAMALRAAGAHVQHHLVPPSSWDEAYDGAVVDLTDEDETVGAVTMLRSVDPALRVVLLRASPELDGKPGVTIVLPPASGDEILASIEGHPELAVPAPRPAPEPLLTPATEVVEIVRLDVEDVIRLATETRPLVAVLEELAEHLATRCDCHVAVLFLRQGTWRVLAGQGLRPLEWRDIDELPPVLHALTAKRPTLTIGDSDAVRSELVGVPLSRHRSLLAMRSGGFLVQLGREVPFRKQDVQEVTASVQRWGPDVNNAAHLLDVADALEPHRLL